MGRCGLSPAAFSSAAAVSGPTPSRTMSPGVAWFGRLTRRSMSRNSYTPPFWSRGVGPPVDEAYALVHFMALSLKGATDRRNMPG